jgi:hypothetical protein
MCGHRLACVSVGLPNRRWNHSRTIGCAQSSAGAIVSTGGDTAIDQY